MLSFTIFTIFAVVALPSLQFTPLSLLRSVAIIAAGGSLILFQEVEFITYYHDIENIFTGDILSLIFMFIVFIGVIISLTHWNANINAFNTPIAINILILFTLIGSFFLISANNLITLILSLEIQGFAVYAIASIYRWRKDATSAGLIYFLLSALSSTLLILGLIYIFTQTSDLTFNNIKAIIVIDNYNSSTITVGICLITIGALFKITAAPFHFWGPYVYDGVPSAVTVWIAIIPKFAIFAFLIRISTLISNNYSWDSLIVISAIASFGIGSVVGLAQTRIKRLLAYSTVNHVGFILVAIVIGTANGFGSYGYYVAQYGFVSLLSLLIVIAIGNTQIMSDNNSNKNVLQKNPDLLIINSFSGLWTRVTFLTIAFAIALYSSAGVPPLIGFYAKWSVIATATYSEQWILAIAGLASSVASAGFYLSVIVTIYFNNFNDKTTDLKKDNKFSNFNSKVISKTSLPVSLVQKENYDNYYHDYNYNQNSVNNHSKLIIKDMSKI